MRSSEATGNVPKSTATAAIGTTTTTGGADDDHLLVHCAHSHDHDGPTDNNNLTHYQDNGAYGPPTRQGRFGP